MKECYAVQITFGSYEDSDSPILAIFTNKEQASRWMSSIDTLLHYAIDQAKEKDEEINYSLFGIEHVQRIIKWNAWLILDGYSMDIETLPLL